MLFRRLLLGAAVLAAGVASASAEVRIAEDRGGQIGQYLQAYASLRSSGERVVVDGNCLSACTLLLGVIPRSRICATERARFGFHAAWMPDGNGRPVTSTTGTRALWRIYPPSVQHWINRHGGLSRKMIFLQGSDLSGIVPACNSSAAREKARSARAEARSRRHVAHRPVRYVAGNGAEDGR
jgi:hypothetical protein